MTVDIEMELASEAVVEKQPPHCELLTRRPTPIEIKDDFSPLFGDIIHAMQRPCVPIKHEANTSYYTALQNAFLIRNESEVDEVINRTIDSGVTEKDSDMKHNNSRIFISGIEFKVPPPSVLYLRVRAVFQLYGQMKDSVTGKPLFNARAWRNANNILCEMRKGYYSNYPTTSTVGVSDRGIVTLERIEN